MSIATMTWFGKSAKEAERKTDEAVSRVIKARETMSSAANRLDRALDAITSPAMEITLGRLVQAKRAKE